MFVSAKLNKFNLDVLVLLEHNLCSHNGCFHYASIVYLTNNNIGQIVNGRGQSKRL